MESIEISLKLPRPLLKPAQELARDRDESLGRVIRQAIADEVSRTRGNAAKTPNRANEQLLGPLRALLAADLAQAASWAELSDGLREKGYALREAGGGLALHRYPDGSRLCKASELGQS